jgi:hypothetical protein
MTTMVMDHREMLPIHFRPLFSNYLKPILNKAHSNFKKTLLEKKENE